MNYTEQINTFVNRLNDSADCKAKHAVLTELCDIVETFLGPKEYSYFLEKLIPIFFSLLDNIPITFSSQSNEHKLRNTVLEILHRAVCNDVLKPYAEKVLDEMQKALKVDNEDNGVLCMKVIINLHKSYKNELFEKVQPFLDIVNEIYANMNKTVPESFRDQTSKQDFGENMDTSIDSAMSPQPTGGNTDLQSKPLAHSMQSFKTLSECPIMMVSLLSSYKQLVNTILPTFIPKLIEFLQLEVEAQKEAREAAAKRNEIFTSVAPEIKNRALYGEFILAQVKAASFLAYIFIRGYSPKFLATYNSIVPDIIMRLLQDCPSELSAARKELLHATRHILSTSYKSMFLPKLDLLFNEKVLLGDGLTAYETLRPLAYSTAADFLHNIRNDLNLDQIWKTVLMYSKLLQDTTLASTVQIMSGKLLLNLLERINKLPKDEARRLSFIIIKAYVNRFIDLNREYSSIMGRYKDFKDKKQETESSQSAVVTSVNSKLPDNPMLVDEEIKIDNDEELDINNIIIAELKGDMQDGDNDVEMKDVDSEAMKVEQPEQPAITTLDDIQYQRPIQISPPLLSDPLKDTKYLFRTLLNFLKSVVISLRQSNSPPPSSDYNLQAWNSAARLFSVEEIFILKSLLRESILGLRFFQAPKTSSDTEKQKVFDIRHPNLPISASKDEKELMEVIASMFMKIDLSTFNEIFTSEISFLVNEMLNNAPLLHLPHFFLGSEVTSANFMGIIINYLKSKLKDLGDVDAMHSHIFLRLFKLCLLSLNLYPSSNEAVVAVHLKELILKSLEMSTKAEDSIVYFYLIRTLFKSISGGRFDSLYKEIMPLLQKLLESLNKLIDSASTPQERDIYIELCLTVPVRLGRLVPYLSYLQRPLVLALNGSQDLVSQGLRTLELCVDNLSAEFLDPIIEPVIEDVMKALWKHLKPLPYYYVHSHTAVRILGKLGGRNRKFIRPPHDLEPQHALNEKVEAAFRVHHLQDLENMSVTTGIKAAIDILENPRQIVDTKIGAFYRINAFKYLSTVLKLFIDAKELPDNYHAIIKAGVLSLLEEKAEHIKNLDQSFIVDHRKLSSQEELAERLMKAVFLSASIEELRSEVSLLTKNICNHFTQLYIIRHIIKKHKSERKFSVDNGEGAVFLSDHILLNAITYALGSHIKEVRQCGVDAIKNICELSALLFGSVDKSLNFILLRSMVVVFFHGCYNELYYTKYGGVLGLKVLLKEVNIPPKWFSRYQLELIRALLFVLRDTPDVVPTNVVDEAIDLIKTIIKGCNENVKKIEDLPNNVISLLVYDLANSNAVVRRTSRESLSLLSELTGVSISKIIYPSKSVLLNPIFSKPLRALPFPMQIGNIEAINFWLSIPHEENSFNEEMQRLLLEVLSLVDADDSMLVSTSRLIDYETREQLTEIRIVCINLLKIAVSKPEFSTNPQGLTRMKILSVLFKTLCSSETRIINAAHHALKAALAENNKLPRNLLQSGLRPMLMNLADHKRLTVSNLEALARLLVLLISYFKVEIGKKLMDHLKAWATPHVLHTISSQDLASNSIVQVVKAILNIFHLLPPRASMFIEDILGIIDYLEFHLRRSEDSPFREPVAKFLNRFSKETFLYYLKNYSARQTKFPYFVTKCLQLREVIKESFAKLVELISQEEQFTIKVTKYVNTIDVLAAISASEKEWIKSQKPLITDLFNISKDINKANKKDFYNKPYHFQLENALIVFQDLYIKHLSDASDCDALITLLETLCCEEIPYSVNLKQFVFEKVILSDNIELRQNYLTKAINLFLDGSAQLKAKVFIFRRLFNPILLYEYSKNGNIKQLCETAASKTISNWLNLVHTKIWKATSGNILDITAGEIDQYRIELLQMTSILISMAPDVIENLRKDVIKFCWNFIKLEDVLTKHAAYLTTCYFINAYATPMKIRTHMLMALLRANNNDTRFIVKHSLELLAPAMNENLNSDGHDTTWLKYPRRVISENGFLINNIFNVYKFIVQHSNIFFYARDHFISNAISAMGKLTLLPNSSVDNQTLAIELAELILKWEQKARKLKAQSFKKSPKKETAKESNDIEGDISTPLSYTIPFGQKEAFVTFLIRYVCISSQRASLSELSQRALAVLYGVLSPAHWPEVTVKLSFFEKFLANPDLNSGNSSLLGYCLNALEVLGVALEHKSSEWITENLTALQELLEKCIRSDNHDIQEVLQRVLRIILKAIKEESEEDQEYESEEIKNFLNLLYNVVSDDLGNTSSLAAGVTLSWTIANYKPERLNPLIPNIMKTFGKLCRDHVTIINQKQLQEQQPRLADEAKMTTKLLKKLLCFAAMRISFLSDQRRIYLSLLAQLIEKTSDYSILTSVLNIVYKFIFTKENLFPTTKEKAAILGKMMGFEARRELPISLSKNFYKMIIKIFEDDSYAFSDLTQRLEQPFLIGTRFVDVGIRKKFMKLLNESIEIDIEKRMFYIFKEQNWEFLADFPWTMQAAELLFGSFDLNHKLKLSEHEYKFAPLDYLKDIISSKEETDLQSDNADDAIDKMIKTHEIFLEGIRNVTAGDCIKPLVEVLRSENTHIGATWRELFPIAFKGVSENSKMELSRCLSALLSKDYQLKQIYNKPNVIQDLLSGAEKCQDLHIPPHLIKYLGITFDSHYSAMHAIEKIADNENPNIKEACANAYAELLSKLEESDLFYGLWRRRAKYSLTNSALSFEQIGVYDRALKFYESAQIKARSGYLPYSEAEYSLWEDNWIFCAEKLQHWDVLTELAKQENYTDLLLECGWRVANWNEDKEPLEQAVRTVIDVPTPRRQIFQTFLCLQSFSQQERSFADLIRCCDEGIQLSLTKWSSLPSRPTAAHTSLLHLFQQYVEFSEASKIYNAIVTTNSQNMELKSQELKRVLQAWRERLPNLWDDINIWNDICTQRLHAYNLLSILNRPFLGSTNGNMYAFRGYHETAYMINRFAHVARKHGMPEVCISQLTKIYTLPNIEISEAFVKLTEQAKCHYQNVTELNTGLDVISNTNLAYFGATQKAEFFTLKGMFQAKLNAFDEANQSFATAVQLDNNLPNAWAEWGFFNYKLFRQATQSQAQNQVHYMKYAGNALTCFLNASGLYKSEKSRKLLALILWLISLDDQNSTLAAEFQKYKGEVPVWYWCTYIPQLLTSLSHREAKLVRSILIMIAKSYPQALHFPLRTTKDDFVAIQKQIAAQNANAQATKSKEKTPQVKTEDVKKDVTQDALKSKDSTENQTSTRKELENKESLRMPPDAKDEQKPSDAEAKREPENDKEQKQIEKEKENKPDEDNSKNVELSKDTTAECEVPTKVTENTDENSGDNDVKMEDITNKIPQDGETGNEKPESKDTDSSGRKSQQSTVQVESIKQDTAEVNVSETEAAEKTKKGNFDKTKEDKTDSQKEETKEEVNKTQENVKDERNLKDQTKEAPESKFADSNIIDENKSQTPATSNPKEANTEKTPADNGKGANTVAKTPTETRKSGTPLHGSGQPWEYVEEIMLISKTSYPLLALSLELLVDQVTQRFKSNADEDAYRLVVALLNDGIQSYNRMASQAEDTKLPQQMENNIARFAGTVLPRMIRLEFEKDLIHSKPNFLEYISKLLKWRAGLENKLDRRFNKINLENLCPHLAEFHHQRFEDIEIPGQYLLNKDSNNHFVKIDRFLPTLEIVRGYTSCFKRLQIRGHDGSVHQFSVQFPSNRHSRREERIFQLFRLLSGVFDKKVQSRSRNIKFTVPIAVALSPHIRILRTENESVTLHNIYEQYCKDKGQGFEEPFFYAAAKMREAFNVALPRPDVVSLRTEIFSAIQTLFVPSNIVHDYFVNLYPKFEDFWLFKKQFSSQYASFVFMTFMMSITGRQPHKIHINLSSGNIWTSEMLPNKTNNVTVPPNVTTTLLSPNQQRKAPVLHNSEPVPFRLTPNIQNFIGDIGLEGIMSVYVLIMARCLSEPEFELEHYLSLFVRDEIVSWFAQHLRTSAQGPYLREIVRLNTDLIIAKVAKVGFVDANTLIATQNINNLISQAVNPRSLAQLDSLWRAYL